MFANAPDEEHWRRDLGGQLRLDITAGDALAVVKARWAEARTALSTVTPEP